MASLALIETPGHPRIARIESQPFAENSYVVDRGDGGPCVVIDPGFEPEAIVAYLHARRLDPAALMLTHGHSDHIAGNEALRSHWPDVPILIGRGDAAKLLDPEANLSAAFGINLVSPPADRLLDHGETVNAAGLTLSVREIPGHSAGHVVYVLEGAAPALVFGGDVLFRDGIGRTDFADGDHAALIAGIRDRLYTLPDETIILPGHGETTTIGRERRSNPFVRDAAAED